MLVKCETLAKYPHRIVFQATRDGTLEARGELRVGDRNLGTVCLWIIADSMLMDQLRSS